MENAEPFKPGEFCWFNMLTPSPEKARAFFGKLLGWKFVEIPVPGGFMVQVGGRGAGAIFDLESPQTPKGTPPMIGVMVRVANAEESAEKVKALGGTASPIRDIMGTGRMSVCHDPNGAQFDLWESKNPGIAVDSRVHGAPTWYETVTTDVARAKTFYEGLFGWTSRVESPAPGMEYTLFQLGKKDVGGLMGILPRMGDIEPHWNINFAVRDVDESVALAKELGGSVVMGPHDIPKVGRFAGVVSPQGVGFCVFTWAR